MRPVFRTTACFVMTFAALTAGCSMWDNREEAKTPEKVNHFEKAVACEREGAWEQAQAEYRLALKDDPNDSRTWVNLGRVYSRAGQNASASACWKKAVEANPNDARAWNQLGGAAMRENNFPEALKNYKKAIECTPDDADLHYNAAIACRSMKMDGDAAAYYRRWLQLSPSAEGPDAAEARQFLAGRDSKPGGEARGDE